jgi:peptide/nickel transport system substrate-binding protein
MKRLVFIVLCIFLVSGMTLIGCAEPEEPVTPQPETPTPTPAPSQPEQKPPSQPEQEPPSQPEQKPPETEDKYGGILKIVTARDARTPGDPLNETSHEGRLMMGAAIEFLGRIDAAERSQPFLAESWEMGEDAKSLTVKLKEGIKFHDGTDFDAEAVKWNWEHYMESSSTYTASIETIDVIDKYTVRANLSRPDVGIVRKLTAEAGAMVSPTAWKTNGAEWGEMNPVGTGPFVFVNWNPETLMEFKKFDGYWQQGKPYLDGVEFLVVTDEMTRMFSFQGGEADVATSVPFNQANDLFKEGKYVLSIVSMGGGLMSWGITFDTGNPDSIFTLKVRQAISHAMNRDIIVDNLLYGFGIATDQWGSPEAWSYNPNLTGYPYNPDRAKELLAEAGYPNGFDTKFHVINQDLDRWQAIQTMLADIGINAELVVHELPGWRDIGMGTGWKDELLLWIGPAGGDMVSNMSWFRSDSWAYVSWLHSDEIDAMIDAANTATTFEKRQELVWGIQKWAFEDQINFIPMFVVGVICINQPYVRNSGIFENVADQWRPDDCWLEK